MKIIATSKCNLLHFSIQITSHLKIRGFWSSILFPVVNMDEIRAIERRVRPLNKNIKKLRKAENIDDQFRVALGDVVREAEELDSMMGRIHCRGNVSE